MAILGCEQLSKHEGLKIVLASIHVKNLINTSQPHLKMWRMLSGGGEYVIRDLYYLAHSDLSSSNTLFSTQLFLGWPATTSLSKGLLYRLSEPSLVVALLPLLVVIGSLVTFLKPFKF